MTPFWPDVGEAGRCFVENARSTWAVASNSEIDFSIYKTQKRWAREVTRSATSTPRVPGGPPPRGANLSRTNRSRGRLHFRSNDRAHYPRISRLIIILPIIREKYDLYSISLESNPCACMFSRFRYNIANCATDSPSFFIITR